jgi:hypothetical protein
MELWPEAEVTRHSEKTGVKNSRGSFRLGCVAGTPLAAMRRLIADPTFGSPRGRKRRMGHR